MILVILHCINIMIIYTINIIIQILIVDSQLILTIINIQLIIWLMGNFRVGVIGVATVHSIFEVQSTLESKVGSHAY